MFRRLAHSLANNDLDASIGEQKAFNEASKKLLEADMKGHEYLFKWAQNEKNPVFRDVFERELQVAHIRFDAYQKFTAKMREARQHFKTVSKEEKKIEDVRKHHANICNRLGRLKKQVDSASKKSDMSKVESLLPELQSALAINDQATIHLEEEMERLEIFKVNCLRDALRLQAEAYQLLAKYFAHLSQAQRSLSDIIPDDPPNISAFDSYKDGPVMSSKVVEEACYALSIHLPASDRLSSFIIVDVPDGRDSPSSVTSTSPPQARFVAPAPTERPPLLPPRPSKPEYLALNGGANAVAATAVAAAAAAAAAGDGGYLDDTSTDYVATEDVEAERRRFRINEAAVASGKPPVARKPKLEKMDSFLKDHHAARSCYTMPRGDGSCQDGVDVEDDDSEPYHVANASQALQHVPAASKSPLADQCSPSSVTRTASPPAEASAVLTAMPAEPAAAESEGGSPAAAFHLPSRLAGKALPVAPSQLGDPSAYQDPADAYLWLWPKGKGDATSATSGGPAEGAEADDMDRVSYQRPWECVSREDAAHKIKTQCLRRRTSSRSSSHSPPQLSALAKRGSPHAGRPYSLSPDSLDSLSPDNTATTAALKTEDPLQKTLQRTNISLDRSERLQASISTNSVESDQESTAPLVDPESTAPLVDPALDHHVAHPESGDELEYATVHLSPEQYALLADRAQRTASVQERNGKRASMAVPGHRRTGSVDSGGAVDRGTMALSRDGGSDDNVASVGTPPDHASIAIPAIRQRLSALSIGTPISASPPNTSPLVVRKRSLLAQADTTRSARMFDH